MLKKLIVLLVLGYLALNTYTNFGSYASTLRGAAAAMAGTFGLLGERDTAEIKTAEARTALAELARRAEAAEQRRRDFLIEAETRKLRVALRRCMERKRQ